MVKYDFEGNIIWENRDKTYNYIDAAKVEDVQKLDDSNDWKYEWLELPKYRNGKLIEYAIAETLTEVVTGVDGIGTYAIVIESDGNIGENRDFVVTNPHTPETVDIHVIVKWEDEDNKYETRPEEVTVYLYADGELIDQKQFCEGCNNWEDYFKDLPKYENGKKIEYMVSQSKVDLYGTVVNKNADYDFTIVNYYSPKGDWNPKTGDSIVTSILMSIISVIGLFVAKIYYKKFNY